MKPTRNNTIPRVFRKVHPDPYTNTIFGQQELKKFVCKSCKGTFFYSDAYLESSSKKKYEGQIRMFCVTCWDKTKGKISRPKDHGNSILEFE